MEKKNVKNIKYIIADAEIIDSYFDNESCDFIYSSNVLEHLPNPKRAIIGIKTILKTNGLTIHIIPSPFNVITRLFLWYPNFLLSIVEYLFANKRNKNSGYSGQ